MNPNVTISPITLHSVADKEHAYDEYPGVGIVARATLTMKDPVFVLVVESSGAWGIEDEDLSAGYPVPGDHWILFETEHGDEQVEQVQAVLRTLLPDNPIPTPTEEN